MRGLSVTLRQASTTRADMSGSLPKATPPSLTLGQEILISMASIGESSKRRVTSIVFLEGGSGDIGDESGFAEIKGRQDLVHHLIHPGILQPDGVEHPARGFKYPMGLIAQTSGSGGPLQADCAGVAIGKACNPCILFAKTHATR